MNYALLKYSLEKPESIRCTYAIPKEVLLHKIDVLIISFFGVFPAGSKGAKHGTYIARKTIAGIIDANPDAVILDFRELDYSWGNSLLKVFQDIHQFQDAGNLKDELDFPVLVTVSEKSKNGIQSLLTPASQTSMPDFIFTDINKAIKEAEKRGKLWLDC